MSHEVESMMWTGNQEDAPWHGLGTFCGEKPLNSIEALEKSGLDWTVKKEQVFTLHNDVYIPIEDSFCIKRETDGSPLGVVGARYEPVQNINAFAFADSLVENGNMMYHVAGSLRKGKKVWILGKIGNSEIVKDDVVGKYFLLLNSHDGSAPVQCCFTTVRVVCMNTARLAINLAEENGDLVSIRHTGTVHDRMAEVQQLLSMAIKNFEENDDFCRYLATIMFDTAKTKDFLKELIPSSKDEGRGATRAENTREEIESLIWNGKGTDIKGVRGTGWGVWNGVLEWVNFFKNSRNGQEGQFESSLFGSGNNVLMRAAKLLKKA